MGKYITENERYIIETMLKDGKPVKDIAERLGKHINTIYGEIKRGTVELLDTHLKPYTVYKADVGQRIQNERSHNKGIDIKLKNDFKTARTIEQLILEYKYSPYAVYMYLKTHKGFTELSFKTIYNYIHNELFLNISDENLTYKVSKKTDKENVKRPCYKKLGANTIEQRPKEIYSRSDFGHWEMDTVVGGKGKSKDCLLVLTERQTRHEIVKRIADKSAQSVLDKINEIENNIGLDKFKVIFRTITCDNGTEFSKFNDLELSADKKEKRTSIFFCHPFASCERGSNENANKLIRKYIPKGSDISEYSDEYIQNMENIINNYPRKLFNGMSSNEYKKTLNIVFQ